MVVETRPVRTRRAIGKLAQARMRREAPEPKGPALIFQAMDALPGYTYPSMGGMLTLAGSKFTMSREYHSKVNLTASIVIKLNKMKGGA